ncbi:hypothetical protein GETHPA_01150 [Geothrix rubra]|uniref:Transglutaminase-like domain-containing protein n=1 Tax=Geothrix rubra TaxID=2927977 RepID=A0ABQ5Q1T0_9BACT|nr:hypothetical protein GETHPA_01150 [Geothrix rubra]
MNRARVLLCLTFSFILLGAPNVDKLPSWARESAREGVLVDPPAGADAWVLLDRTEFAYAGSGEVRQRRYRLVRILSERGLDESIYVIRGLGGKGNRIKRLRGWNCRPDGEVTKLDQDKVVTVDSDDDDEITTGHATLARLPRVVQGSLVAFESEQVVNLVAGPGATVTAMQSNPVRRWELELATSDGWFTDLKGVQMRLETRDFKPWLGLDDVRDGTRVLLKDVPALPKDELATPDLMNVLPRVHLRFIDATQSAAPVLDAWDSIARWEEAQFRKSSPAMRLPGVAPLPSLVGLRAVMGWISHQVAYRKVYLTPERGWVPENAEEVARKRYGDCKDMTALFLAAARGAGFEAFPVLARIITGRIPADQPVGPDAFNHVIVAVRLPSSFGLPAEMATPKGRFLLADPTDAFTPLGQLGDAHRNRRVMICLPDGAQWVQVPATAVLRPEFEAQIDGQVDAGGRLKGRLVLQEVGDAMGLRSAFSEGTPTARKDRLGSLLSLPLDAQWTLREASDPRELTQPLRVVLDLDYPGALRREGRDWVLSDFLFPSVPTAIQRPGTPRCYPVAWTGWLRWTVGGRLSLPDPAYRPVLAASRGESPFRTWTWKAEVARGVWTFGFTQERQDAWFDFEHREDGVRAAKKDRSRYRELLDEAPALRLGP